MRKKLINPFAPAVILLVTLGVASCEREDEIMEDAALPVKESAIYKHIADHKKERTRSGEVKLEPVVYAGDTVMYIANYGEGWEIFSNSTTMPMVLLRSETGHFDASALAANPAFAAFFNMSKANLVAEMHDASAEAQPGSEEWAIYGVQTSGGGPKRKPAPEPVVLVGIGYQNEELNNVNHLTKTRWDHGSPYNQFIPLYADGSGHAPAGCGAIAVAQYLYYYHNKFGSPTNSVTSVSYDLKSNRYSFSGASSTIWSQMPLGAAYLPTLSQAHPAALLIGDVANKLNAEFATKEGDGTSTSPDVSAKYISQATNQNLSHKAFSAEVAYNLISTENPILTSLKGAQGMHANHAVLIDAARLVKYSTIEFYVPKSVAGGETDPYQVPTGVTYEMMVYQYGNVVTSSCVSTSKRYYFKMNWGWGIG